MVFPRIQAIRYPQQPGHDLCYGLRLSSSSASSSPPQQDKGKEKATHHQEQQQQERKDWAIELGKITDDSLKSQLVKGYVGLADGYYYFHITTPTETHTLLATLFLTDLITSHEASSILSRGPHSSSSSPSASTLSSRTHSTIHRLPSLATLYGAYWAASSATAEALASATAGGWLAGAGGGVGVAALPVGVGVLAVGGIMMVFSRSNRAPVGVEERGELVREEGEEERGMEMIVWKRAEGRRWVDVERVEVLEGGELEDNPLFPAFPSSGQRSLQGLAGRLRIGAAVEEEEEER